MDHPSRFTIKRFRKFSSPLERNGKGQSGTRTMLRRSPLPRRPCFLNPCRRTSNNSPPPKRDVRTALLASLLERGFTLQMPLQSIKVDRKSGKQLVSVVNNSGDVDTFDLRDVGVFSERFQLLPLDLRTYIEKRDLLATMRKRLKAEYEVDRTPIPPAPKPEVPVKDIKKQIRKLILQWKMQRDEMPTKEQFSGLVKQAQIKAKNEFKKARERKARGDDLEPLTWEQQWRRRDVFGTPFSLFSVRC
jgi:hypothetical protein